jgi:cytochrome P450 PksS
VSQADIKIASAEFKANPYPFYAWLRAEAPVYRVVLPDKRPAWLISRYADVAATLRDERFIKNRYLAMSSDQLAKQPWRPGFFKPMDYIMLELDAPDHTRLRGLVHKAFTPRLIENMRERILTISNELVDVAERRGQMDLIRDFALPLPVNVICDILGIPPGEQHKFHRWSNAIIASTASRWGTMRMIPDMVAFLRYIRRLIQMRRADPQDDLTSMLVQAEEAGDQLSEDELVAMIFLLLVAGHETTVNLIGNGMLALLEHRDQMEKLQNDPSLMKPAVEELLRYDSPVEMADTRYAREAITIEGVTIPRGEIVFAVIASANRDETQFLHPDRLDITRDPNRHLAFGQGIHYCLGAPLARLEGQIAIHTLLTRMPDLQLAVPSSALRWRKGLMLRGLESLPVAMGPQRAGPTAKPSTMQTGAR